MGPVAIILIIVVILVSIAGVSFLGYYLSFIYSKNIGSTPTSVKIDKSARNPPYEAMKNIHIRCPDLWVDYGVDGEGNRVCRNTFNVPIRDAVNGQGDDKCYSNFALKEKKFPNYSDFDALLDDKSQLAKGDAPTKNTALCQWKTRCGPVDGQEASWSGIGTDDGWVVCT